LIEVIDGSFRTTIQDVGRTKGIDQGFSPSGSFDSFAFRLGNLLVGNGDKGAFLISNEPGKAGLEIEVSGFKAKFLNEHIIAITGGNLSPQLNGKSIPMWETLKVKKNDVISFGNPHSGLRSYLSIAGGIDVPDYLGSKSTFLRGSVGGYNGRKLKKGDILKVYSHIGCQYKKRRVESKIIPEYTSPWKLRVIMGPQDDLFVDKSLENFVESEWTVSLFNLDRMAIRLHGPKLEFRERPEYLIRDAGSDPSNIVEDAIPIGGIQAPSGRELIVMGVDGPSMGGFAKIATVINPDISKMAQIKPGEKVRFIPVSVEAAVEVLKRQESILSEKYIITEG